MERRNFIKNTALSIGAMVVLPSLSSNLTGNTLVNAGQVSGNGVVGGAAKNFLVSLNAAAPQIRHGLLNLPQLGFKNEKLPFDWLGEIRRNVFFQNGFQESDAQTDIEIVSILFNDVSNDADGQEAIQVQIEVDKTTVLFGAQEWRTIIDSPNNRENIENGENDGLQKIGQNIEGNFALYIGVFESETAYKHAFASNTEVFVHVLNGDLTVNQKELKSDFGLGLKGVENIEIEAQKESKILVLEYIV